MIASLQTFAGVDVADRHREKDETDRQHDDVHHGNAPWCGHQMRGGDLRLDRIKAAQINATHSQAITCQQRHRNSRGTQGRRYRNSIKMAVVRGQAETGNHLNEQRDLTEQYARSESQTCHTYLNWRVWRARRSGRSAC